LSKKVVEVVCTSHNGHRYCICKLELFKISQLIQVYLEIIQWKKCTFSGIQGGSEKKSMPWEGILGKIFFYLLQISALKS
jgi:hypothetical protein